MKMKTEKARWVAALLTVALLACITYSLSDVVFQTNDDQTIICLANGGVTGSPAAGSGFTSYGYGLLLAGLYGRWPGVPWHALLLSAGIWLCLTAILRSLFFLCAQKRQSPLLGLAAFLALYAGVGMKFVCYLQFTTAAGFGGAAAAALLFTLPQGRRACRWCGFFAMAAVLFGLLLRPESGLLALPVPLLAGLWQGLTRRRRPALMVCAVAVALTAGVWLADGALHAALVPGWQESQAFDSASAVVLDYRNTDETYRLARQHTDWTEELCQCFRNWELLFDRRFNTETLNRIAALAEAADPGPAPLTLAHKTLSMFKNTREFRWNALAYGILGLWALVLFLRRRDGLSALAVVAVGASLVAVVALFYGWLNRLPDRVAFVYALPSYTALLFLWGEAVSVRKRWIGLALLLAAAVLTVAVQPQDVLVLNNLSRRHRAAAAHEANVYAARHPQYVYVTDVSQAFYAFETETPPVNLVEWCSPLIRSAAYQEKLRLLGYPQGLDTLNLADEKVRLLIHSPAAVNRLTAALEADGLDWQWEEEMRLDALSVYRLKKTGQP